MAVLVESATGLPDLVENGFHVDKEGRRFYYELHGSGPHKVLFIPGMFLKVMWRAF